MLISFRDSRMNCELHHEMSWSSTKYEKEMKWTTNYETQKWVISHSSFPSRHKTTPKLKIDFGSLENHRPQSLTQHVDDSARHCSRTQVSTSWHILASVAETAPPRTANNKRSQKNMRTSKNPISFSWTWVSFSLRHAQQYPLSCRNS